MSISPTIRENLLSKMSRLLWMRELPQQLLVKVAAASQLA